MKQAGARTAARAPRQAAEIKALVSLPYLHNDAEALRIRAIISPKAAS